MDQPNVATQQQEPWNKGKLVGQKCPVRLKEIGARRMRPQICGPSRRTDGNRPIPVSQRPAPIPDPILRHRSENVV